MLTQIVPLVKDKKGDVTSKDNYRPIALTSMLSKVLELIILSKYEWCLDTAPNQFGYKYGLSAETCIFSFKEIVNYYRSLSSNVYVCYLDASKAFDRVNHYHLFSKLISRNMPKLIVRILFVWYQTQLLTIKWCNYNSSSFNVSNGVRQGGILSPWLFNVFIDNLSNTLNKCNVGCYLNNVSFNHIQYADDSVIIAPSPTGLQRLLDICEKFARDNDMIFNSKKTFCMVIKVKPCDNKRIPDVFLNGKVLKWIDVHKYLGVYITCDFIDDRDIIRQRNSLYAKGNALIRKFKSCTDVVKDQLFQSYCSNFYSSALWCMHTNKVLKSLNVAYNNVYRYLHCINKPCSISQTFVMHNIDTFNVLQRKSAFSLMSRIYNCDNTQVMAIVSSSYNAFSSSLCNKWHYMLY